MVDLRPRIEKLVGSLSWAGRPGGQAPARATAPAPLLHTGDPGFAEVVASVIAMPLDRYAREGVPLEIRVPWHGETLWLVPENRQAEALVRQDVSRGRVWTARELTDVVAMSGSTLQGLPTVALAKLAMDGDVVEVKPAKIL